MPIKTKKPWATIREQGGRVIRNVHHGKGTTHPPIAETAYSECGGCGAKKAERPVLAPDGVLTAASSVYWPTLSALVEACVEQARPIAVADHGLTTEQRAELTAQGVTILDGTLERMTPAHMQAASDQTTTPVAPPAAWFKPWVCSASPFQRSVWIDADAVPVGDIEHLFAMTRAHSWITRNSCVADNQKMYRAFVDAAGSVDEDRYGVACQVNTGVFGFRRGDAWIDGWQRAVRRILDVPALASLSNVRDQSAAVLMFATTDDTMPALIWDEGYNYPANRKPRDVGKFAGLSGGAFLAAARREFRGVAVAHWLGNPKPWSDA